MSFGFYIIFALITIVVIYVILKYSQKTLLLLVGLIMIAIFFNPIKRTKAPRTKEIDISSSRQKAESICSDILRERYSTYRDSLYSLGDKGYRLNRIDIEEIKKNLLLSNDSILYVQVKNDKFKFKYKIDLDSEVFDYELNLIEENNNLEDNKK